ncbi:hypothetical protein KDH_76830 [Dictyobacter sp. S3.2.2.5]|uniref:Uncharacterized protein n=1 Tax=Dictyobacter halimunensis TaxID=3026934 RepID=A0ABQ6G2W4_9CHLR|nr:hypothetical protein KDH_76830 [Dictyobacter sp. S3.2.2.5]
MGSCVRRWRVGTTFAGVEDTGSDVVGERGPQSLALAARTTVEGRPYENAPFEERFRVWDVPLMGNVSRLFAGFDVLVDAEQVAGIVGGFDLRQPGVVVAVG